MLVFSQSGLNVPYTNASSAALSCLIILFGLRKLRYCDTLSFWLFSRNSISISVEALLILFLSTSRVCRFMSGTRPISLLVASVEENTLCQFPRYWWPIEVTKLKCSNAHWNINAFEPFCEIENVEIKIIQLWPQTVSYYFLLEDAINSQYRSFITSSVLHPDDSSWLKTSFISILRPAERPCLFFSPQIYRFYILPISLRRQCKDRLPVKIGEFGETLREIQVASALI